MPRNTLEKRQGHSAHTFPVAYGPTLTVPYALNFIETAEVIVGQRNQHAQGIKRWVQAYFRPVPVKPHLAHSRPWRFPSFQLFRHRATTTHDSTYCPAHHDAGLIFMPSSPRRRVVFRSIEHRVL